MILEYLPRRYISQGEFYMASDKIVNVTDDSFESEVKQSQVPVLVDFWASWCAPCKAISPMIDDLADQFDGQVKVCKVNVDENPATPGQFGVRGIPTLILFKDGEVLDQVVGAVPKGQLEDLLKKSL